MRPTPISFPISLIILASFLAAHAAVAAPITVAPKTIDLKSKAKLEVKGVDNNGSSIKLKKLGKGKVKFDKKKGPSADKVKKKTTFSFEKGKKLPKLKIKGQGKFDKKKLDKLKPFGKKKKIDIFDKKNKKRIASFEFPIEVNLDLTRAGLISGFSFEQGTQVPAIRINDTTFLGLSAASIPEPKTVFLLGIGMFGLVWFGFGREHGRARSILGRA